MNWQFLFLQLLALLGLLSFMVAAVYYVRHRHTKAQALEKSGGAGDGSDGGAFLKRYVPPEHRTADTAPAKRSVFASRRVFYFCCTLIPCLFLTFTAANYYANREHFLEDIVLEESERLKLTAIDYQFDAQRNPYAVRLSDVANAMGPTRNFVVMRQPGISNHVADSWVALLTQQGVRTSECVYGRMNRCQITMDSTVVLSLQEASVSVVQRLSAAGVNVLAYDFPTDPAQGNDVIPGLSFISAADNVATNLAVVGDRELTLGLDAGSNLTLVRLQDNVRAVSDRPQAISMFSDVVAGGAADTRLYASSNGVARTVWMDFSVGEMNYLDASQKPIFSSIIASVLRYLAHQDITAIATWPEARRYAAFFEEDTEFGYINSQPVADLFASKHIPLTWYVLSDLAKEHREKTRHLAATGEMACHGDNHDIMPRYKLAEQVERLARCMKVVHAITGEMPSGFRPPTEAHNNDTLSAMLNVGMTHLFAENSTSTQVPHFKRVNNSDLDLVSIPRGISDDFYLWHFLKLDGKQSIARMRDELAWIRQARSLFSFSFHTQFMADPELFNVVRLLLDDVSADSDVYVNTVGDIAQWWRVRDALMRGEEVSQANLDRYKPVVLTVNSAGELEARPLDNTTKTSPVSSPIVLATQEEE